MRDKTRVPTFATLIQPSTGSYGHSDQKGKINKMHPTWKGGSKTVIICRQHDSVHRKPYRLHSKSYLI